METSTFAVLGIIALVAIFFIVKGKKEPDTKNELGSGSKGSGRNTLNK